MFYFPDSVVLISVVVYIQKVPKVITYLGSLEI